MNRHFLTPRYYRVVRSTNDWNISGWRVEAYWPLYRAWVPDSRLYFTRWGAALRARIAGSE